MGRLTGKIAIVTGAASGIGAASAKLFAEEGAQVLAVDRPESAIETAHAGNDAIATVRRRHHRRTMRRRRSSQRPSIKFGAIDILFNNAGVSGRAFVEEMTDEMWDRVNGVNVRGMFRLCREAIPALKSRAREKGRARIVNTASVMAFDTDYGLAAYCASKAGRRRTDPHAGARARQVQHHGELRLPRRDLYRHDAEPISTIRKSARCGRRRRPCAGLANPSILRAARCCWPPTRPISSPATSWWSMAASPCVPRKRPCPTSIPSPPTTARPATSSWRPRRSPAPPRTATTTRPRARAARRCRPTWRGSAPRTPRRSS